MRGLYNKGQTRADWNLLNHLYCVHSHHQRTGNNEMRILKSLAVLYGFLSFAPAYASQPPSHNEISFALIPRLDEACAQREYHAIRRELIDEVHSYGPQLVEQAADMPLLDVLRLLGKHEQADKAEARWRNVSIICQQP